MSDINFCNTKEQLNHLGEVVTGKVDGSPTGADIDTSTLPYTGQVRKTLPALEAEYEQSITDKEAEADAAIDSYRLLSKGPYASGITLESKFEYITYNGESYFAVNPPYTTTATLPDADGNLFVGGYLNQLTNLSASPVTATGSTTPRTLADRFSDVVNVRDFGAVGDGVTDDSAAFQGAINMGRTVLVPTGTYRLESTVSLPFTGQEIRFEGGIIDLTGQNHPAFTIGQNADGSLPPESRFGIKIDGMKVTGDKTPGSCGIYFRRASTNYITNCRIWSVDYAIGTDADFLGSYESLCNRFDNLDLRFNTYGIYDPTGGFQASSWNGCRIEGNDREGFSGRPINYFFNNCTIEGNSKEAGQQGEIHFLDGSANMYITDCYFETARISPSTHVNVFFNESPTLRLNVKNSCFYHHETSEALIGGLSTITEGSLTFDGCFFNNGMDSIYRGSFTGNSYFTISNCLRQWVGDWVDTTLFTGGAGYSIRDRLNTLTNSNLDTDRVTATKGFTIGVNTRKELHPFYIGLGDAGGTTILFPTSDLEVNTSTYVEITFTGRESPTASRVYKVGITFNSDGSIADQQELYRYNMSPPVISVNSGNLVSTNLSQYTTWSGVVDRCHSGFSI